MTTFKLRFRRRIEVSPVIGVLWRGPFSGPCPPLPTVEAPLSSTAPPHPHPIQTVALMVFLSTIAMIVSCIYTIYSSQSVQEAYGHPLVLQTIVVVCP